jgi:hypothetical protein
VPARLMLDPSLFLSPRTSPILLETWQQGELEGVTIPASFARSVRDSYLPEAVLRYFGAFTRVPEPSAMRDLLRVASTIRLEA